MKTSIKKMVFFIQLMLVWGVFQVYASQAANANKPNIIFIFADDWGYGDLGIHGSTFCKTPHIDKLADQGIDFQNFTVNYPVCTPSRTAVMTGYFPARCSVHNTYSRVEKNIRNGIADWLDPKLPMLPRMLQKAGYSTGHFGKWHLTNNYIPDAPSPLAYGYDEYAAFNVSGEQTKPHKILDKTIDFINRNKNKPFFINLWIHETHTPHYPKAKYMNMFKHLDEKQQVYAAVVAEADDGVGKVMETLKELDIDKNTLVIFSSDNGPEWVNPDNVMLDDTSTGMGLGEYFSVGETSGMKGRKRSLYEGGVRVPFIACWPDVIPKGKVDKKSVITAVDLLPTFLELAELDLPDNYEPDGQSMARALKGKEFNRHKSILWHWTASRQPFELWPHLGIREGKWKLLINEELGMAELYDIDNDRLEQNNLAKDYPEVVKALTQKLNVWNETLPTSPPASCFSKLRDRE